MEITPCSIIQSRYQYIDDIGSGVQGKVVRVSSNDKEFAMKLQLINPEYDLQEFQLLSELQNLAPYTPSIIYPIEYFLTDPQCYNLVELYDPIDPDNPLLLFILITPLYDYEYRSFINNLQTKFLSQTIVAKHQKAGYLKNRFEIYHISILFELTIALILLKQQRIYHGDINANNIMVNRCDKPRKYVINNDVFMVTLPYVPIFIDFGNSGISDFDDDFISDWLNTLTVTSPFIELYEEYEKLNSQVIYSSIFDSLRQNTDVDIDTYTFDNITI